MVVWGDITHDSIFEEVELWKTFILEFPATFEVSEAKGGMSAERLLSIVHSYSDVVTSEIGNVSH